ncbi:MAG: hypothetical protein MK212_17480, partial [Saprospiraceae bacterium]|nr:hypothetical protein [Saprospiraceae bacterium]
MRNLIYLFIYLFLFLGFAIEIQAQCTLSASSSGGNTSYTQVYVLVNSNTGIIVAQNTTGIFASVSTGTYHIHALNYDPSNAPSPLPTVGQNVSSVGTTTAGCYNNDFLTDYVIRTCSSCQQNNTICETDPLVVSSSGGNGAYTQLYVLVNASSNLIEATNSTGNFTGMVSAGTAYQVYALNYNPSDAPNPLPTVGQAVSMVGTTSAGCYNSDFLTDYICYTITNCATSCVRDYNVCENEDIVASSSGNNASYTQVYVLADNSGNFVAQNTTGIFSTSGFTLGDSYHVHALNYNPSDAPSPLPSALSVGDPLSNISGGCYNSDFLIDYVCYTIGCPCTGKLVEYAPNQVIAGGTGVEYTNATAYCEDVSGWRYYYDPAVPNDLLFAIEHKPTGGNTNDFQATVTLGVNDYSSTTGYNIP